MSEYIFSVCIPVYNTEKYLSRALDSIVHQTFDLSKVEVVVVNDASPNTGECNSIIEKYSNRLSIQYFIHDKNAGTLVARKTGVEKSKGLYILFLDPDDQFELYTFEILSNYIIKSPDYIQFEMYSIIGNEKQLLYHSALINKKTKTLEDVLQNKALHNPVDKCYKAKTLKTVYKEIPPFYAVYAEDYYHSVLIEYYSHNKVFIDIPLYNYFREIGVTSDSTFQNKTKVIRVIESFQNIEHYLVAFFEEKKEPFYAAYVQDCIKQFYCNLSYWTTSIYILFFIMKRLPDKYRLLRLEIIRIFLIHNIKKIIKCVMPYGLLKLFQSMKKIEIM